MLTLVNVLINLSEQWTLHLLDSLIIYKNTVVHCLFMLVHSALLMLKQTCDFNNALVNAEINIKINKGCRCIVHS